MAVDTSCVDVSLDLREPFAASSLRASGIKGVVGVAVDTMRRWSADPSVPLLLRRFGLRDQEGGWGGVVGSCVDGCRTLQTFCSFVALASGIKRVVAETSDP